MNEIITHKSINQERSQLINRALVADLLRQEGVCSRATLAQLSGLKQATITNIIGEFIECGLVVETGLMSGCKGRRSIGVTLNDDLYKVIGIRMTRRAFYISIAGLSERSMRWRNIPLDRATTCKTPFPVSGTPFRTSAGKIPRPIFPPSATRDLVSTGRTATSCSLSQSSPAGRTSRSKRR